MNYLLLILVLALLLIIYELRILIKLFERYVRNIMPFYDPELDSKLNSSDINEKLLTKAAIIVKKEGKASVSLIHRKLNIGYARASRIMDLLEQRGFIPAGKDS